MVLSAHDIFKEVKNEIFNLIETGELEIPICTDDFQVPTPDDMLKAYWQDEDNITVEYNGKKKLIPCPVNSKNEDYIARCIMQGFAQIKLNRNESMEHKNIITRNEALNVVENTIARLVNEGVMDLGNNNNTLMATLDNMCSKYQYYTGCDTDGGDVFVDFGDLCIYVSVGEDNLPYVKEVRGKVLGRGESAVWVEVSECINRINSLTIGESRNRGKRNVNESFKNNQNYTHFAVNKATNKIVNGWDYRGYDPEELKQFKKDYFIVDLVDYGFNPKDYKIVTGKFLLRNGIDPDDNGNWANS